MRTNDNGKDFDNLTRLVNRRDFYDIMSALRGPDNKAASFGDCWLKCIFTERLRYLVGIKADIGVVVRKSKYFELADLNNALGEIKSHDGMFHYLSHVHNALDSLLLFLHKASTLEELRALITLVSMMQAYHQCIDVYGVSSDIALNQAKKILIFAQESDLIRSE